MTTGDVFAVPFDATRVGYGQVISLNPVSPVFVYIFEPLFDKNGRADVDSIVASKPLLMANTFDALLVNGHWPIVGRAAIDNSRVIVPLFKVMQDGKWMVEGFFGKVLGCATTMQVERLPLRYVSSPMILEDAFRAHHGAEDWRDSFDKMLYSQVQHCGTTLLESLGR